MNIVIIGAGPAGIVAAETLRRGDSALGIEMVTTEPYPPYAPPALADHLLTGRTDTLFWKGRDVCEVLGVMYHSPARVVAIDPGDHRIDLADRPSLRYDALLIASGSRLHAPVDGAELPGVHDFKSLRAAESILARIRHHEAATALIVGAGFIGTEIALTLADLGLRVTVIEAMDRVMPRMLDLETAEPSGIVGSTCVWASRRPASSIETAPLRASWSAQGRRCWRTSASPRPV
jgi:NADPH-dependent 2,4-dienoyl-CoA reductase/sulfur reductase-like enzyme